MKPEKKVYIYVIMDGRITLQTETNNITLTLPPTAGHTAVQAGYIQAFTAAEALQQLSKEITY